MAQLPRNGAAAKNQTRSPVRDRRFLTFLGGVAMADVGDQAWIVMLAYTAAQSGNAIIATLTVAAGTIPRAILDLVGGAIADRLPTRPLLVGAAGARVAVLAIGLLVLLESPDQAIPIMVVVAVFFGAADALHKPAVGTVPRQLVPLAQVVRAASLRQLVNRMALLLGPAIAGVAYAAVDLTGSMAGLLGVFAVAAVLLLFVRIRYQREHAEHQSVVSSTRQVLGYLRRDVPARALVLSLVGLNFFVIPVINAGIALRVTAEDWGPQTLGILTAAIGVGAVVGTAITLRISPDYPMRFALSLLVIQGGAIAVAGVAPMVGVGVALGIVGLTAGLSSPLLSGTAQSIVDPGYIGRIFALLGLADDALIPFALVGYGVVSKGIGVELATVLCGAGMALLMGMGLLRRPLRNLRLEDHGTELAAADEDGRTGRSDGHVTGSRDRREQTSANDPAPTDGVDGPDGAAAADGVDGAAAADGATTGSHDSVAARDRSSPAVHDGG